MIKNIILMSYGKLASGLLSSVELITGEKDNVFAIDMYLDDEKLTDKLNQLVKSNNIDLNESIIITDIMGGSVNQEVTTLVDLEKTFIVAGMNLPLLLTLVTSNLEVLNHDEIKEIVFSTSSQIVLINDLVNDDKDDFDF